MQRTVRVEEATLGGPASLLGRPSATRPEWEAARVADAADLNRFLEIGGDVENYIVPLWSGSDVERSLNELRGFEDAQVFVEFPASAHHSEIFAAIAVADSIGVAYLGEGTEEAAAILHECAALEIPVYLPGIPRALAALALAIENDLSPREIEAVLRGEVADEADEESLAQAGDLLTS